MRYIFVVVLASFLLFPGCTKLEENDINIWMENEKDNVNPENQEHLDIKPPQVFEPAVFTKFSAIDPFDPSKLLNLVMLDHKTAEDPRMRYEMDRVSQPLEAYPIDSIKMVGSLQKDGKHTALVNADKLLYQVSAGSYLGQDYGLIQKISETEILIRELFYDTDGQVAERMVTLNLQEKL